MHYIYTIQNKINLKIYVGYSGSPKRRWQTHKRIATNPQDKNYDKLLYRAIRKYGCDNFVFQIIETWEQQGDALDAEKFWIEYFRSNILIFGNNYGYNLHEGGNLPPKAKKGQGKGRKGRKWSDEEKRFISKINKGKIHSLRSKQNMSDGRKGMRLSEEHKKAISDGNKGKIFSEIVKQKISQSKMGHPVSEENKNKMRHPFSREQLIEMRLDYDSKMPLRQMARKYGVDRHTIKKRLGIKK